MSPGSVTVSVAVVPESIRFESESVVEIVNPLYALVLIGFNTFDTVNVRVSEATAVMPLANRLVIVSYRVELE